MKNKKERIITRTITVTHGTVHGIDLESQRVSVWDTELVGKLNEEQFLSELRKKPSLVEHFAPAFVSDMTTVNVLYGISEKDFVLFGHVMKNRSKANDEEYEELNEEEDEEEDEEEEKEDK